MTDFSSPFKRGIDAAKLANSNRLEIQNIFDNFNAALSEMTDDKVEIVIVPFSETLNHLARLVNSMGKNSVPETKSIAIRQKGESKLIPKHVARWIPSDQGYPCTLVWNERHVLCEDAEALTAELGLLFSSPVVGEAIVAAQVGGISPGIDPNYW